MAANSPPCADRWPVADYLAPRATQADSLGFDDCRDERRRRGHRKWQHHLAARDYSRQYAAGQRINTYLLAVLLRLSHAFVGL